MVAPFTGAWIETGHKGIVRAIRVVARREQREHLLERRIEALEARLAPVDSKAVRKRSNR